MTTKRDRLISANGYYILIVFIFLIISNQSKSENLQQLINLEGTWKFSIGDDPEWAEVEFDDKNWDFVYVPRSWERSGYVDYNGFGWYRKTFTVNERIDDQTLFLVMGYIDDVDEVYLNGHLIGTSGVFPPMVNTAFSIKRKYPFPQELLNIKGKNVIAVRVFDEYRDGGIYAGPIGVFTDKDNELLMMNLSGYWNFDATTNTGNRANQLYNQDGDKIFVPGYWESLGYANFDGNAIYTKAFYLPSSFNDNDLMLVLGYIDDVDKAYINDTKIGSLDDLKKRNDPDKPNHLYLRGYPIPTGLLLKGDTNYITVKVYDVEFQGGIYEGPIGLISNDNFKKLKKKQVEKPYSLWDDFIKHFFD